jgi:hypothetical protein
MFLSAGRMVVTLFRGDEIVMLGPVRWDTVLDSAIVLVVLLVLAIAGAWRVVVDK